MNALTRGLSALTLIILFQTHLFAEYLYKDEIVHNPNFSKEIEILGSDLYKKTGITLRLVMLKELPDHENIVSYEKELLKNFSEPTVVLVFTEMDKQVDIWANDKSLYKYFDKKGVLSPVASKVQAFLMGIMYAKSWDDFQEIMTHSDGSILPLLGGKAKKGEITGKYAAAMFNGYLDIAQQIARSRNVKLDNDYGETNKTTLFYVKLLFYGFVLYGIIMYIRRIIYKRRHKNEHFKKW
ncbi:MAG TPA: 3-dehydroquinate dehydratase [Campylobacterales bacterium]|nr:3-dehydroquinate dehydratase [Campylobacterales bacterium]